MLINYSMISAFIGKEPVISSSYFGCNYNTGGFEGERGPYVKRGGGGMNIEMNMKIGIGSGIGAGTKDEHMTSLGSSRYRNEIAGR